MSKYNLCTDKNSFLHLLTVAFAIIIYSNLIVSKELNRKSANILKLKNNWNIQWKQDFKMLARDQHLLQQTVFIRYQILSFSKFCQFESDLWDATGNDQSNYVLCPTTVIVIWWVNGLRRECIESIKFQ